MSAVSAMGPATAAGVREELLILCVDDDPDDRELIADSLQQGMREPYQLHSANCLGDAMQRLRESIFDVALLDLNMPDAGGVQAVRDVRALRPDIAIVALSGQYGEPEVRELCLEAGAQDFIEKSDLSSKLLSRSIGSALFQVRELQLDELERSFAQLRALTTAASGTQMASQIAGVGSMKYRLPIVFNNLSLRYNNMFKAYARFQAMRVNKPTQEMHYIVDQLALHNASPRDLMDLHMELGAKDSGSASGAERFGGMGRLLLLELLGMLATYYRELRFAKG